jgi:hypothetical protein
LRVLGAEARGCAPPDWAERSADSSDGKATRDEDVLDKRFDRVGGAGDSIGHRSATEHGCSEVSQ